MSSANVLPSAPPELYPNLPKVETQTPSPPHDFRLTKINEIAAELAHEDQHYRIVAKK